MISFDCRLFIYWLMEHFSHCVTVYKCFIKIFLKCSNVKNYYFIHSNSRVCLTYNPSVETIEVYFLFQHINVLSYSIFCVYIKSKHCNRVYSICWHFGGVFEYSFTFILSLLDFKIYLHLVFLVVLMFRNLWTIPSFIR